MLEKLVCFSLWFLILLCKWLQIVIFFLFLLLRFVFPVTYIELVLLVVDQFICVWYLWRKHRFFLSFPFSSILEYFISNNDYQRLRKKQVDLWCDEPPHNIVGFYFVVPYYLTSFIFFLEWYNWLLKESHLIYGSTKTGHPCEETIHNVHS